MVSGTIRLEFRLERGKEESRSVRDTPASRLCRNLCLPWRFTKGAMTERNTGEAGATSPVSEIYGHAYDGFRDGRTYQPSPRIRAVRAKGNANNALADFRRSFLPVTYGNPSSRADRNCDDSYYDEILEILDCYRYRNRSPPSPPASPTSTYSTMSQCTCTGIAEPESLRIDVSKAPAGS